MRVSTISSIFNFKSSAVNVIYVNDIHGSTQYLEAFANANDKFRKEHQGQTNLGLSGGDLFMDRSPNNLIVCKKMNKILDASAVGNHDLEGKSLFNRLIEKSKFKWLAANVFFQPDNPLTKNITQSCVIDKNGDKIGVIGVAPFDYKKIAFVRKNDNFIEIDTLKNTVNNIKKEVKEFESQGINKIFLLAHTGAVGEEHYYKEFAKIGGIDVIIGGHDHFETDEWDKTTRNEPVKIVSTGESDKKTFGGNLDSFGVLELKFDGNGVLIKDECKNIFEETKNYEITKTNTTKIIHKLSKTYNCSNPLTTENPVAEILADAYLWTVNTHTRKEKADFAFVNSGTIRGNFDNLNVSNKDIIKIVPFVSAKLIKTTLTKKQIIDTLNWCLESTTFSKISPGIMQVSGMEYTVTKDLKVKDVRILNEDGSIKVDLSKCSNNDRFVVVYDDFLATGVAGLKDLKKEKGVDEVEYFRASRQSALRNYLERNQQIREPQKPRIIFE